MPSARPKKSTAKSSSSTTLFDFFARKRTSPSTSTARNIQHKGPKCRTRVPAYQEIIVIDSDSEDEQSFKRVGEKRRRLSNDPSQSAVQEYNATSSKTQKGSSLKMDGTARLTTHSGVLEDKASCLPEAMAAYPSFGIPTLLIEPSAPSKIPAISFGAPSHLLAPPKSKTPDPHCSFPETDVVTSSSKTNLAISDIDLALDGSETESIMKLEEVESARVDIDLTSDNLWETGDDETEAVSEETSVDYRMEDILQACPLCDLKSTGLSEFEFQTHINGCLDSQSNETPTLESTENKPYSKTGSSTSTGLNAFTKLQESMAENEAWNELNNEQKGRPKGKGARRKAPFYKVLQGMPIAVDAFCYGNIPDVTAYFLTHAHSDHYTNLSSSWRHGPIYCSQGTANLIIHMLSVDPKWVHPLPMDTPTVIPNTNNVTVTLIDANHCPGSSLFFFEGLQSVNAGDSNFKSSFVGSSRIFRYLHCGDFRASPQHVLHPCIKEKKIDHVYLDTTYLDPKYTFPPQALVISACAEIAKRLITKQPLKDSKNSVGSWLKSKQPEVEQPPSKSEKFLVVVGTYSIGKERVVKAVAQALNSKVYCDKKKAAILRCQEDPELHSLLTSDPLDAMVHLAPLGIINVEGLSSYLHRYKNAFTKVIGFRPTGWCFTPSAGANTQMLSIPSILSKARQQTFSHENLYPGRQSSSSIQLISVPYSEHSSFNELTCFAMSLDWVKMIPTVNVGSETSRRKMSLWIGKWETELKKHGESSTVPHRHPEYW